MELIRNIDDVFRNDKKLNLISNYQTMQKLREIYKMVKKIMKREDAEFDLPLLKESFEQIRNEAKQGLITDLSPADNLKLFENVSFHTNMNENTEQDVNLKSNVDFSELIKLLKLLFKYHTIDKSILWITNKLNLNKTQSFVFSYHSVLIEVSITGFSDEPMLLFVMSDMKEKVSIMNYKEKNQFKTELLQSISHE